jgi:hypothetical protein
MNARIETPENKNCISISKLLKIFAKKHFQQIKNDTSVGQIFRIILHKIRYNFNLNITVAIVAAICKP